MGILPGLIGVVQATETVKIILGIGQTLYNQHTTYAAAYGTALSPRGTAYGTGTWARVTRRTGRSWGSRAAGSAR